LPGDSVSVNFENINLQCGDQYDVSYWELSWDDSNYGNDGESEPTLEWNTFLGDSGDNDSCKGVAADSNGNVYLYGTSYGEWGKPIIGHSGNSDVFVAKLNSEGVLQWNTFLGSTNSDYALNNNGITADSNGNVYIVGESKKTWGSPTNGHTGDGQSDGFIVKLNTQGVIQWLTFIGEADQDRVAGIALDSNGNMYIGGYATKDGGKAYAAKLNSNGVLQWKTMMGANGGASEAHGVTVDNSGNVYITGHSNLVGWGTPVTDHSGRSDAFIAKLDGNGVLQMNTFMGSENSEGRSVAVDNSGNIYVVGHSIGSWGNPINEYNGFDHNAFLAQLNSSGVLQWNTFLGSFGNTVLVDNQGYVYVAGHSNYQWGDPFIASSNDNAIAVIYDAFAAKLDSNGLLKWNAFLGSESGDYGETLALDASGNVYVAGRSQAEWGRPVTPHSGSNSYDSFVAKISVK
jgi:hypothetical protein